MTAKVVLWASLACAALVSSGTSFAMAGTTGSGAHKDTLTTLNAPDYGGVFASGNYNTPAADGRPGMKFFAYGVVAYRKGDYRHAIDMYQVAASWAYKPAEYNLGLMYFNGVGVPANHPLGAAWMVLAAERQDPYYAKVRDMMVTLLSNDEFKRADAYYGELVKTYGDKVALKRAENRWARVASQQTGSRVGGAVGESRVCDGGNAPDHGGSSTGVGQGQMRAGCMAATVGYAQFRESKNPYSPVFLENRKGKVTVESLTPIEPGKNKQSAKQGDHPRPPGS